MSNKGQDNSFSPHLQVGIQDDILLVGLNRPDKRNALNDELITGIGQVFSNVPEGVRCGIIYSLGKHFSAGLDLSELQQRDAFQGLQHSRMWHQALDKVQFGSIPVIAVLKGAVVGGGLELAAACHLRIAETDTFYALPEGQRGIFVGGGASVRLPRLIGMARVTDMMLTGRVYTAEEGERIGMAQYLTQAGAGMAKAKELAAKITGNAAMTNYALMHILPRISDAPMDQGLMLESLAAAIAQDTPEAKKRLQDFLDGKAKKAGE